MRNDEPFRLDGGKKGVLLIHGFTGSPSHMRPLGEYLHDAGYTVRGPLLPGHGTSLEDMNTKNANDWLACVRTEYSLLRAQCDKVAVGGLSMGGTLATILAEEYPVDACMLFSPCIWMRERKYALLTRPAALFRPYMRWDSHAAKAEPGYEELHEFDCGYSGMPVAKGFDLYQLTVRARMSFANVKAPCLIFQAGLDEVVDKRGAQRLYDRISSEKKELVWLEKSRHVCTIGPQREQLFAQARAFLDEQLQD